MNIDSYSLHHLIGIFCTFAVAHIGWICGGWIGAKVFK